MRTFITMLVLMTLSVINTQAQNENKPEWQQLTEREQKALRRAEKDAEIRAQKREKALQKAKAERVVKEKKEKERAAKPQLKDNHWFAGVDIGSGMAFGDDDDNLSDKFSHGSSFSLSGYVGYHFNNMFGARLRLRHLKQYNRCNLSYLELIAADKSLEQYFPNKGFYGYNTFATEVEGMLNLSKLFSATHDSRWNVYMLLGTGVNWFSNYDKVVDKWQKGGGIGDGWSYPIDTKTHAQWLGVGGLLVDYRLSKNLSINFDLSGTTTTDNMEGVISEEWYDVYITWGLGLTYHF